ncbi:MAG: N-acetyl-anhydromuramyl-L-alanine amidase AmpD, partial [Myxococcota bacterium]
MANEIIIAGERFRLAADDITVVTFEDVGSFSFPAVKNEVIAKMGIPPYGDRIVPGKGKIKTAERLKEEVHQIVLHTDLTADSAGCFRALKGRGLSTHFMIDWDGTIYQTLDVMYAAYHAGDANNASIGVDMNNRMRNLLKRTGDDAAPYLLTHERIAEMSKKEFKRPKSSRMRINGAKVQSYGYTDAQYLALIELIKELSKHFKKMKKATAPFDAKGDIVPKVLDDFAGFNGFLGHMHISPSRWDPGPGFDWQRVFHALGSEHNSFPIELQKGKNIRTLLVPGKVKEYAEQYFERSENSTSGWYPIGANQTWHGGIHLGADCGTPVRAMFDGTLVAARFSNQPTKLGHNNFMLLRHSVPIPGKSKKAKPKEFIFYSLYMHLLPVDTDADAVTK